MKSYKFKNLKLDQSSSFKFSITKKILKNFFTLSKDYSSIHTKTKFAQKYGFNDKIESTGF